MADITRLKAAIPPAAWTRAKSRFWTLVPVLLQVVKLRKKAIRMTPAAMQPQT
jgi:hypothetical protein